MTSSDAPNEIVITRVFDAPRERVVRIDELPVQLIGETRTPIGTWENARNERAVEAKWQFTTAQARIKLHRLYPSIQ